MTVQVRLLLQGFVIGQQTIQFTPVFAINGSCKRQIAALATIECFNQSINIELETTFDDERSPLWLYSYWAI